MTLIEIIASIGLFLSILAVYVKTQVDIAKMQTTIVFFQKDLDRKERALILLENNNRDDHKEILNKIDKIIENVKK